MKRIELRRDDGVAMTEFALVLPVLVLIIAGILSFGRVFFYWIEANHLASETARWAVVDQNPYRNACPTGPPTPATFTDTPGCQSLQQAARDSSSAEFKQSVKVCITFPEGKVLGKPVLVKVQKPFSIFPLLDTGATRITIRGSSEMRIEQFLGSNGTAPQNYDQGDLASGACS